MLTCVLRTAFGPVGHPAFTSATGVGVAYAATRPRGGKSVLVVIGGWCLAVFLHMSWNLGGSFGEAGMTISLLFTLDWITVLIVLLIQDRKRLIGAIGQYLPMYEVTGILTGMDIPTLSTLKTRRQARQAVRRRFESQAAKVMSNYNGRPQLALLHASASTRTVAPQRFATASTRSPS